MDYNTGNTTTTGTNAIVGKETDIVDDDHPMVPVVQSKAGNTPTAVILARNIQKFFANKLEKKNNKNNDTSNNNNTNNDTTNTMDVCAVLQDVDEILDHRSIEDGRLLLRGMVADLLKEIDLLRYKYDTLYTQYITVKEERDVVNHIYNDKIDTLTLTLQQVISSSSSSSSNGSNTSTTAMKDGNDVSSVTSEWKDQIQNGKIVTAEEATMLTIQTLTKKIESLHIKTMEQQEQIIQLRDELDDVKCDNDAKVYKIMALEKQFNTINQKRSKMITKFPSINNNINTSTSKMNTNGNNTSSIDNSNNNKTKLVLQPLRLDSNISDGSSSKGKGTDIGDDNNDNKDDVVDYNLIYQDNKENIIANIIMTPRSNTILPTNTNTNEEAVTTSTNVDASKSDNDTDKHQQQSKVVVDSVEDKNKELVLKEEQVASEINHPTMVDEPIISIVQTTPSTPLDVPDDENSFTPTNVTLTPKQTNASSSSLSSAVVITPPPQQQQKVNYGMNHKNETKKIIFKESSNSYSNLITSNKENKKYNSNNNNIHSQATTTTTTTTKHVMMQKQKPHHGPSASRGTRLVKLVEQV